MAAYRLLIGVEYALPNRPHAEAGRGDSTIAFIEDSMSSRDDSLKRRKLSLGAAVGQ